MVTVALSELDRSLCSAQKGALDDHSRPSVPVVATTSYCNAEPDSCKQPDGPSAMGQKKSSGELRASRKIDRAVRSSLVALEVLAILQTQGVWCVLHSVVAFKCAPVSTSCTSCFRSCRKMAVPKDLGLRAELLTAKHAAFIKKFAEASRSDLAHDTFRSWPGPPAVPDVCRSAAEHKQL